MKPPRAVLGCVVVSFVLAAGGAGAQVIREFTAGISVDAGPASITAGPDGNLWFTEVYGNRIGRITPAGVVTEFSAGISADAFPQGITSGPDGNLWFTEQRADRIGRMTPSGVVTEFSAGITAGAGPGAITAGPDGNLWFAEYYGHRIGRITPAGVVTEFTVNAGPSGITTGPDGNLWFTAGNRIGRITPAGAVTEFSAGISIGADLSDITAGPDGNLWFTEHHVRCRYCPPPDSFSRIGRITPAGVVTEFNGDATSITAGPDGNLWFTAGNLIGRITLLGVITEFGAGISEQALPGGITTGPDGNLWFTEFNGSRIGRLIPGVVTAQRTFVSGQGDDANPCAVTGPCRQLSVAMQKTTPGGEIVVLDSAAHGPIAIDRPLTIVAPPGVYAGISVPSGHGIDVDAGGGKVTLRGLTIIGRGGDVGINFMFGRVLYVENCIVTGFSYAGLSAITPRWTNVYVSDSTFRNNSNGAFFGMPAGAPPALLTQIERGVFENNATAGVGFTGNGNYATIIDSVLTGNTWGLDVNLGSGGAHAEVDVRGTRITKNVATGLRVAGAGGSSVVLNLVSSQVSGNSIGIEVLTGAAAYVTDTTITRNTTGIAPVSGTAVSLGDNRLTNNGTNGTFTVTAPKQ